MNRRRKDFAQMCRLETAVLKLEAAKLMLMGAGEPMLSAQVSAMLSKTQLELSRARKDLGAEAGVEASAALAAG